MEDQLTTTIGKPTPPARIRINKYSFIGHIYFFFNAVGLPMGLLYTHIFAPFFYIWLPAGKRARALLPFLLIVLPYDIIHLLLGVDMRSFILSNLLLLSAYIFTISCLHFINHYKRLHRIFRQLLISNFIFTLIAACLFFTSYREALWYIRKFTQGIDELPRLALLTYEASYYALLFLPIASYFLCAIFFGYIRKHRLTVWCLVLTPMILSLSVGVITASFAALILTSLCYGRQLFYRKSLFYPVAGGLFLLLATTTLLFIFFPHNPLFLRIENILAGRDTSANGRVVESFTMGYRIAGMKSLWFGAGLGQIKILAPEMVRMYYHHWGPLETVRIPNAMGETFAAFGISGMILRIGIELYFFFRTRVTTNYYRTLLFLFIFIYQFTGSYLTNIAEYAIWALAFSRAFPKFNIQPHKTRS